MCKQFFCMGFALLAILLLLMGCTKPLLDTNGFTLGSGDHDFSMRFGGLDRTYSVHVPPSYDKKTPLPVVLAFHGGGGDATDMRALTGLDAKADEAGFIVVYPEGTGKTIRGKTVGSWNAGRCCPPASRENVDDVGFVSKAIDQIQKDFAVDNKRVFATGHSNGGMMVYRLGCELSGKIAAIAPLGAQGVFETCNPVRSISVLHIHGTKDRCARFEGGTCGGCFEEYLETVYKIPIERFLWDCESVADHVAYWKKLNNLSGNGVVTFQNGDATCTTWGPGADGTEVALCTVEGLGHTWPNGGYGAPCAGGFDTVSCKAFRKIVGEKTQDIIANDAIWDFFEKHPMN